jgi:glycerophosphoryl diester phosphodiesterase
MAQVDPEAELALLTGDLPDMALIKSLGAVAAHPNYMALYRAGAIASLKEAGLRVNPWTVDEREDMLKLQVMGVDALITNRPDVARANCFSL